VAAAATTEASQPVLENPATQVLLELAHDEARKAAGFFCSLPELGPVLRDDLVQEALLGAAAGIAVGARLVGAQERDRRSDRHEQQAAMPDDRGQLATR
jgi:hypothetical protein